MLQWSLCSTALKQPPLTRLSNKAMPSSHVDLCIMVQILCKADLTITHIIYHTNHYVGLLPVCNNVCKTGIKLIILSWKDAFNNMDLWSSWSSVRQACYKVSLNIYLQFFYVYNFAFLSLVQPATEQLSNWASSNPISNLWTIHSLHLV